MKVAIVGGGLAAMYAVLACTDHHIIPTVYTNSMMRPSGAVFLRWLPERVAKEVDKFCIQIQFVGNRLGYIQKQFLEPGIENVYASSFPDTEYIRKGYDPDILYNHIIQEENYRRIDVKRLFEWEDLDHLSSDYDRVFYSFPSGDILRLLGKYIVRIPVASRDTNEMYSKNKICYDGIADSLFVRVSTLFGKESIELPRRENLTQLELNKLFPRYSVNFIPDIHPSILYLKDIEIPRKFGKLIPIGRLARMERHLLSEDTYPIVSEELENA